MQLTVEQEQEIHKIMASITCPKSFRCCDSGFEDLPPVKVYKGANVVQCQQAGRHNCPTSSEFHGDIVFCRCPLRNYLALHLEGQTK